MGKDTEAKEWLDKVVAEKASPQVIKEAQSLRAEIDTPRRPQRSPSVLSNQARERAQSGTPPAIPAVGSARPRYFAQITTNGPIRQRQLKGEIGVLESPDATKSIGTAHESGSFDDGQAAWNLIVRGTAIPGRFVIANREFRPTSK
jgi:hypothetical protein